MMITNLKKLITPLICTCILGMGTTAHAFHFDKSKHSIQFGGASNTGNSETTNMTAAIISEIEYKKFTYGSSIEGQLATSQGVESARSLKANGNINYALSERTYSFVKGSVLYDKYATYDFIIREVAGFGAFILKTHHHRLSIEAGPGGIHRRISGTEDFQNEPLLNISGRYSWHINETADFNQTFSSDIARLNTHLEAKSAISTKVVKNLALELSFTISHDTVIPPLSKNTRKTDTATKATIVYTI